MRGAKHGTRCSSSSEGTVNLPLAPEAVREKDMTWMSSLIVGAVYILVFFTFPISVFWCFKVVQEYERAVIFRLGRLKKGGARGPGLFFVLPLVDNYRCVGLRTGVHDIPAQLILTRDSVTVQVDAVVFYQVSNPLVAVCSNKNFNRSTMLLASTMLRNTLGTRSLSEILQDRELIADSLHKDLEIATDQWGVHVVNVEIKDVILPTQMQRCMAAEAEAVREARAKVIYSEGEQKAAKGLKEAADVLSSNKTSISLRYLQEITNVSAEKNSTIVFPLPIDLIRGIRKRITAMRRVY